MYVDSLMEFNYIFYRLLEFCTVILYLFANLIAIELSTFFETNKLFVNAHMKRCIILCTLPYLA